MENSNLARMENKGPFPIDVEFTGKIESKQWGYWYSTLKIPQTQVGDLPKTHMITLGGHGFSKKVQGTHKIFKSHKLLKYQQYIMKDQLK